MAKKKENELEELTSFLTGRFRAWEAIYKNGCSDPNFSDGVNLNLVRNHIISTKHRIREYIEQQDAEISLFATEYPDIYFRETPSEVPQNYMAKADEIRQRAHEQLALYESDPNFQYILKHHDEVFKNGETKATKQAGLSIYKTGGLNRYRRVVEEDHLVYMRSYFYEPYEEKAVRWAEGAKALRDYLSVELSNDDITPVRDTYDEEYIEEGFEEEQEVENVQPEPAKKPSLDEQIKRAVDVTPPPEKSAHKEAQLSLF